jgi:hypothetical protein
LFSPNDEFADFELFSNLINVGKPSQVKYGYIRQALTDGLMHERELGVNPFKYGIVAGADVHSGYSGNEEFNWHGAHGALEDSPEKRLNPAPNASGDRPAVLGSAHPSQSAVYYVRVLEIPTPRWSTYDSVRSGLSLPEGIPATLQERAWSSPIWYSPAK